MNKSKAMPSEYLFWAVKQTELSHLQFRILVTMCDAYGKEGCWLSQGTIATRAKSSRSTINKEIKKMVKAGLISSKGNAKENGAQTSNRYEFPAFNGVSSSDTPVTSSHTPCALRDTTPVSPEIHPPVSPEIHETPIIKHPLETPIVNTTNGLSLVPFSAKPIKDISEWPDGWCDAQEFYKHYPRKAGKAEALKAWRKLNPSDELLDTIMQDIVNRVEQGAWCTAEGKQYIPHASTYLNKRRWEDEIIPRPEFKPSPEQRAAKTKKMLNEMDEEQSWITE